jgi:hypothetical protein
MNAAHEQLVGKKEWFASSSSIPVVFSCQVLFASHYGMRIEGPNHI